MSMTPEQTNLLAKIVTESATYSDFSNVSDRYDDLREFFLQAKVKDTLLEFGIDCSITGPDVFTIGRIFLRNKNFKYEIKLSSKTQDYYLVEHNDKLLT
jgi:hypothetical protein